MPIAFAEMTRGGVNSPVAPVDLSQAIIGPGMAIFSKYKAVLEADGTPMNVGTALRLINRFFGGDEDFDAGTLFALQWFELNAWATGKFGEAQVLAQAKGIGVDTLVQSGIAQSGGGEVRLLRWQEMPEDWNPTKDSNIPAWEALHQLILYLNRQGEKKAGQMLAILGSTGKINTGLVRALAYRLYTLCERTHRADDARAYNEFIISWTHIEQASLVHIEKQERGSLL